MQKNLILTVFVTLSFVLYLSLNNFTANADQLGSQQSPYPVYQGWQGAGYYYFPAHNNFETDYITNVCQLNLVNVKLTGSELEPPYDQNQILQCIKQSSIPMPPPWIPSNPPAISLQTPTVNGFIVSINGATQSAGQGATITKVDWDWGDGQQTTGWFPQSHTYSSGGTYTVAVTSYDSFGKTASVSTSINVQNPIPPQVTNSSEGVSLQTIYTILGIVAGATTLVITLRKSLRDKAKLRFEIIKSYFSRSDNPNDATLNIEMHIHNKGASHTTMDKIECKMRSRNGDVSLLEKDSSIIDVEPAHTVPAILKFSLSNKQFSINLDDIDECTLIIKHTNGTEKKEHVIIDKENTKTL